MLPGRASFTRPTTSGSGEDKDEAGRSGRARASTSSTPTARRRGVCPPSEEALAKARKPRPGTGSLLAEEVAARERRRAVERTVGAARVAFRDVTRATDSRTVRACLVPPEHFLTNSAPYLAFVEDDPRAEAACLALMNSLAFDWQARRFVETHSTSSFSRGSTSRRSTTTTFDALAAAAARLSCPDERFADFAAATGVECGQLDDDERTALRAEIDARVARAWDLTADELELIFADFTVDAVPEDYREAVRALRRAGMTVAAPALLDNREAETAPRGRARLPGRRPRRQHPLSVATGYVNLGGLTSSPSSPTAGRCG